MDYKEILPPKALRKFDAMCLKNEKLHQNKELQLQILSWAADTLEEARAEWSERRNDTIESVIECHTRSEAKRKSDIKDQKYAPFREYLKKVQREQFDIALQNGYKLTANSFVEWFLANKANEIQIPYVEQNQKNKLRQLAQQNNRE
ncbi:MAG: hypothetical protein J6K16_01835, partial [Alphaproteobacteria bacterium]|nr:hypothetical protein [Alphaproteobacteria bacterium]